MMLTIWRTQFLAFLCICSFNIFIALAAPVSVTPHYLLPKDESPLTHTSRDVHLRDINLPSGAALRDVLPSDRPRTARRAQNVVERSPQTVRRRGLFSGLKKAVRKIGGGIKRAVKKVSNGVKHAVKKVSNGVKRVAQGVKKVAHKVGNAVKKVAQPVIKAANWVKKNGAAIAKGAKAGLKVMSTVASVASRVASFVPGAGKVVSQGLKVASSSLNKGSNAIPGNLGRFGKVMDKVQNPIGGAGGAVLNAILKRDDVDLTL